jgi:hypothetical protein
MMDRRGGMRSEEMGVHVMPLMRHSEGMTTDTPLKGLF